MESHVDLKKLKSVALPVGVIGLAASVFGFTQNHDEFAVSWLMGWTFWFNISLGSLAWLMIFHLTSGRWGYVLQRPFETAARLIPVMLLLFVPVLFSMHNLYEWTHEHVIAHDEIIQHKLPYLNEKAFFIRCGFYFIVWTFLAYRLSGLSRRADANGNPETVKTLRVVAAPGILAFALTASFASYDWYMSLEPHWFSSIFGPIYMVSGGLLTMLFMAMLAHQLSKYEPLKHVITTQQFHDFGNWCFAFTILWTYMNFVQFLIIWSGNMYEETFWYLKRSQGGWLQFSAIMAIMLFFVPFFLFLYRNNKRKSHVLAGIALVIFCARYLETQWMIAPTFKFRATAGLHWMDVAALAGIGGLWLWLFANGLKKVPLLSGDARFVEFAKGDKAGH